MEVQSSVNAHLAHRGLKFKKQETHIIELKENISYGDCRLLQSDTFKKVKSTDTLLEQSGKDVPLHSL